MYLLKYRPIGDNINARKSDPFIIEYIIVKLTNNVIYITHFYIRRQKIEIYWRC